MKTHRYIALACLLSAFPVFAEDGPPPDGLLKSLLSAVESNSVEKLAKDGDEHFKATVTQETKESATRSGMKYKLQIEDDRFENSMTKERLSSLSKKLSPQFKSGYITSYFGKLRQKGFDVHIYRLEFKGGGDDVLATLCVKDGKVGGFWLQ